MYIIQISHKDGSDLINNEGIVMLIVEEYQNLQVDTANAFGSLKIIYCTPCSLHPEKVKLALG